MTCVNRVSVWQLSHWTSLDGRDVSLQFAMIDPTEHTFHWCWFGVSCQQPVGLRDRSITEKKVFSWLLAKGNSDSSPTWTEAEQVLRRNVTTACFFMFLFFYSSDGGGTWWRLGGTGNQQHFWGSWAGLSVSLVVFEPEAAGASTSTRSDIFTQMMSTRRSKTWRTLMFSFALAS